MAIFTDNFTGTSGDLVSGRTGWNKYGSGSTDVFQVNASNQAKIAGTFPDDGAMYGQDPGAADHFVEATLFANAVKSKCSAILSVRVVDRNDRVSLEYDDGSSVWRIRNGGASIATSNAFGAPGGEKYRFQCESAVLKTYKNDSLVWTYDAVGDLSGGGLTNTKVGALMLSSTGSPVDTVIDDWRSGLVSDLAGGAVSSGFLLLTMDDEH